MDDLQDEVRRFSNGIQEIIECPVCFNTMDARLKLCVNGHGVCGNCAVSLDKCPTCRRNLVFHQNTALLVQILERLPKQCIYAHLGCDATIFDNDHEQFCEYRIVACFKTNCEWQGHAKDLLCHVKSCLYGSPYCEISELNVKKQGHYTFIINETKEFYTPIIYQNQVFWKYFQRNFETECISHSFYHVPTSKPSKNYYLVISFKKGKIKYTHTCKAFTNMEDNFVNDAVQNGLFIPESELEKFLNPIRHTHLPCEEAYTFTSKLVDEDIF